MGGQTGQNRIKNEFTREKVKITSIVKKMIEYHFK